MGVAAGDTAGVGAAGLLLYSLLGVNLGRLGDDWIAEDDVELPVDIATIGCGGVATTAGVTETAGLGDTAPGFVDPAGALRLCDCFTSSGAEHSAFAPAAAAADAATAALRTPPAAVDARAEAAATTGTPTLDEAPVAAAVQAEEPAAVEGFFGDGPHMRGDGPPVRNFHLHSSTQSTKDSAWA